MTSKRGQIHTRGAPVNGGSGGTWRSLTGYLSRSPAPQNRTGRGGTWQPGSASPAGRSLSEPQFLLVKITGVPLLEWFATFESTLFCCTSQPHTHSF